ncbi:MAG: PrgI family protein [bacterium]|nr:PrgI family protein [bacterium]
MKQFQTPQFITVEDKVIGPFTIKQFVFIAAGGLLIVFLRTIFEGFVLYLLALIIGSSAAALAFLKINEQSLPKIVKNAFLFYVKPRLYVWRHEEAKKEAAKKLEEKVSVSHVPKMSISKLDDLSWSLDVKEDKK